MRVLGIETSCDDTSVALLEAGDGGFSILSEKTASQIDIHKRYGGVVPEVAARMHAEAIVPVIEEVVGNKEGRKPDVIAVTAGPGLITSLLVGVEAAKTLAYLWNVPLVGVNHIEGHIHSVEIENRIEFPALCLVVSGGHTELILMRDHGVYERIGTTRDDAAGECFDKVAKLLGHDYPGGPKISKIAKDGNPNAIKFPRPMIDEDNFDFSFAGLKTAALYWLRDNTQKISKHYILNAEILADFCASFEQAIVDVLVNKTLRAAQIYKPKNILLVGGVSANKKLQQTLQETIKQQHPTSDVRYPTSGYSMDNAAMIAVAGYYHAIKNDYTPWQDLVTDPNWRLGEKQEH